MLASLWYIKGDGVNMDKANIDKENIDKADYTSPEIIELGLARDIIKNVFRTATGDTFPGVSDELASS